MASWITLLLLLVHPSVGLELDEYEQEGSVRIAARGMGESLSDPWISTVYRPSLFTGGMGLVVSIAPQILIDAEIGYTRQAGQELLEADLSSSSVTETIELIPASLMCEYRLLLGRGEIFGGLGPAVTAFKAIHSPNEENEDLTSTAGTKISMELRAGFRMDTGMIWAPIAPVGGRPIQGLDLEVYAGRRHQFHSGSGYNLSAWRAAAGLAFRF